MEERRLLFARSTENSCCEQSSCDQHIQGAGVNKTKASHTQQDMIFARAQATRVHQCQENINGISTCPTALDQVVAQGATLETIRAARRCPG
jgi:hypothetical protein